MSPVLKLWQVEPSKTESVVSGQKVYKSKAKQTKGPQVKRSTSQKVPKSKELQVKRSPVKRSTKI